MQNVLIIEFFLQISYIGRMKFGFYYLQHVPAAFTIYSMYLRLLLFAACTCV